MLTNSQNRKKIKLLIRLNNKFLNQYTKSVEHLRSLKEKAVSDQFETYLGTLNVEKALKNHVKGARLSALKYSGINSLKDLQNVNYRRLLRIRGIGDKSAYKIIGGVRPALIEAKKNFKFRFNMQKPTKNEIKLMAATKLLIDNKFLIKQHQSFENTHRIQFKKILLYSHPVLKFIFRRKLKLFLSKHNQDLLDFLSSDKSNPLIVSKMSLIQPERLKKQSLINHFEDNVAEYYSTIENVSKMNVDIYSAMKRDLIDKINKFHLDTVNLNVNLRPYQEFGSKFSLSEKRIIIGDEMGLGKTIQAIALIAHLKSQHNNFFLVVCPASVMINWYHEIKRHSNLSPTILHGVNYNKNYHVWKKNGGVAITTFQTLVLSTDLQLEKVNALIIDEAHYVKNPKAKRTMTVKNIINNSEYVLMLSGTPLENKLTEFTGLIEMLNPAISRLLRNNKSLEIPAKFRETVAPIYLRRKRNDVLNELPEIIEVEQWVEQNNLQKEHYIEALKSENFMMLRRSSWITSGSSVSPKMERLEEIQEEARENDRKIIVFSFFRDVINLIYDNFKSVALEPITGDVASQRRHDIIEDFKKASAGSMIVSQIEAGGVGLNIQAASVVVICEPQLKPSTEVQAIGRSYRMGQNKDVIVYRLLTKDSIDEYLYERLYHKQQLFDAFADDSALDTMYKNQNNKSISLEKDALQHELKRFNIAKAVS